MGCVSTDVTTFVIGVNDDIESHELPEVLVGVTKHVSVVGSIIEGSVGGRDISVVSIAVVIDDGSNSRNLSAKIESILKGGLPVLGLVDTILISLGEFRSWLADKGTGRELGHRVHVFGKSLKEFLLISGKLTSLEHVFLE